MEKRDIFFFVGTEAELIKIFPVMVALEKLERPYRIIASGQNDITQSKILAAMDGRRVDLQLSREQDIVKSTAGLLRWFLHTRKTAVRQVRAAYPTADFTKALLVIHGDTVSTVMGALVGKKLGMTVAHVEAGMRSHNIFSPFPEEIDRMLASRKADYHFAPGPGACANLKKKKNVVDTHYNTIYDALQFSYTISAQNPLIDKIRQAPYFVFVLHRQENLMNKKLVRAAVQQAARAAENMRCVMILHKPTEIALQEAGLLAGLQGNSRFFMVPRMEYFDFMKLLHAAEFVVTDGGSNQQELHYMGKPCLILRTTSETKEGLGANARLYGGDVTQIQQLAQNYPQHKIAPTRIEGKTPAQIVAETLAAV